MDYQMCRPTRGPGAQRDEGGTKPEPLCVVILWSEKNQSFMSVTDPCKSSSEKLKQSPGVMLKVPQEQEHSMTPSERT